MFGICFLALQVALQTNAELLQLPDKYEASDSAAILAQVSAELISPAESTRLEALHWVSLTLLTSLLPPLSPNSLTSLQHHLLLETGICSVCNDDALLWLFGILLVVACSA